MNVNIIEKSNQIIKSCDAAYMGVIDEAGCPSVSTVSRIMGENILEAFFSTTLDSNKAKRLLKNNKASICYRSDGNNITLVGTAEIVTEQTEKSRLWQDWFLSFFTLGETDPNYCIIHFKTKRVSLWVENESAEFTVDDLLTIQSRCGLLCKGCAFKEPCGCGGCIETNGNPFHGECPVAVCCQSKGFTHCGQCPDMPCDQLNAYSCLDKEHGDKPPGARISILNLWNKN